MYIRHRERRKLPIATHLRSEHPRVGLSALTHHSVELWPLDDLDLSTREQKH